MEYSNDIQFGIGCILYVVYIVGINWSYLKEYKSPVIKRGIKNN